MSEVGNESIIEKNTLFGTSDISDVSHLNPVHGEIQMNTEEPTRRVAAVATTLNLVLQDQSAVSSLQENELNIIRDYYDLIKQRMIGEAIDDGESEVIMRSAVALLDRTLLREIATPQELLRRFSHIYARESQYDKRHALHITGNKSQKDTDETVFLTPDEVQAITELAENEQDISSNGLCIYSTADELLQAILANKIDLTKIEQIVVKKQVTISELSSYRSALSDKLKDHHVSVVLPLVLTDKVGAFVFLNFANIHNDNKVTIFEKLLHPSSPLPRQDVWKALLNNGIPIVVDGEETQTDEPSTKAISKAEFRSELSKLYDKYRTNLPNYEDEHLAHLERRWAVGLEATSEDFERLREGHQRHYKRFLTYATNQTDEEGKPYISEPKVVEITRGGVSANEVALRTVEELFGPIDNDDVALLPGFFYFENWSRIQEKWNLWIGNVRESSRILLVNYEPSSYGIEPRDYEKNRENRIVQFVEKATRNPDKEYYVVIDKTANPNYFPFQSVPDNMHIFESFSLTKHQRGGRNYFHGVVSYRGKADVGKIMEEKVTESRGTLTDLATLHVPRITKAEVAKETTHMRQVGEAFKDGFDSFVVGNKVQEPFSIDQYTYFAYCRSNLKNEKRYSISDSDLEALHIVSADSFGLNNTRYTTVPSQFGGSFYPRISFGRSLNAEDAKDMGYKFAELMHRNS